MFRDWISLAYGSALLGMESQEVIALRLAKLARGGKAAHKEAQLMVNEKVLAFGQAAMTLSMGSSSKAVLDMYRRKVRDNRARLSRH